MGSTLTSELLHSRLRFCLSGTFVSVSSSMFNCSLCWPWAYVKPVFVQSCAVAGEIRCYAVFQRLQANNKTVVCFV